MITNPAAGGAADSGEQTSGGAGESGGTRGSNPALAGSAAALAGLTDMSATPGPNDPRFVTVTLTPEEQAHIETVSCLQSNFIKKWLPAFNQEIRSSSQVTAEGGSPVLVLRSLINVI